MYLDRLDATKPSHALQTVPRYSGPLQLCPSFQWGRPSNREASGLDGTLPVVGEEARLWWRSGMTPWATLSERREQLAYWRRMLGNPTLFPHWYVVDGPEVGGLQLVIRRDIWRPSDMPTPALLDPAWYPGRSVPDCVPGILCNTTERILRLSQPTSNRSTIDALSVLSEVAAVFIALVSSGQGRRQALDRTADWLERVADRNAAPNHLDGASHALSYTVTPPRAAIDGLRAYEAALTEHVAAIEHRWGIPADTARIQIVGRLAHATSVLGRLSPGDLRGEARLLRSIDVALYEH
jgi:hypothetical protein